jgi:hypothetical protein
MIGRDDRRVGHLRLAAPDDALIRRGTILLEDALRTASVPSLPAGRLLIVRSLALGRFAADRSPVALSLSIEERLRRLGHAAVYGGDEAAAAAPAVYFRDDAEPYALLARRLVRGAPTDAWFWPLAARGWTSELPRAVALRALLFGALQTAAGPAAALAVVRALSGEAGPSPASPLSDLLAVLNQDDGRRLLVTFGWPATSGRVATPAPSVDRHIERSRAWQATVADWATHWGSDDARSLWLAAVALTAGNAAGLADATLPVRARNWLAEIASGSLPEASSGDVAALTDLVRPRAEDGHVRPNPGTNDESPETEIRPTSTNDGDAPAMQSVEGEETAYAGLFFLISLLEQIGMAAFLADHPDLAAVGLPLRILWAYADRFRVPSADPLIDVLSTLSSTETVEKDESDLAWSAPVAWRAVIARGPARVHAPDDAMGLWLATDGSGRLSLAAWHGEMPGAARSWCDAAPVRADRGTDARGDLDLLVAAWLRAVDRWRRRYVGIGFRELICRSGRLLATGTHLDIAMDLRGADIRVRRAGLDLDPGWVPWLGRVVTFTYV